MFPTRHICILFIILNHSGSAQDITATKDYQDFIYAWQAQDNEALRDLNDQITRSSLRGSALALTVNAAVQFRASQRKTCLAMLDSLEKTLTKDDVPLRAWSHMIRAMVYKQVRDMPKGLEEVTLAKKLLKGTSHEQEFTATLILYAEIQRSSLNHNDALANLNLARSLAENKGMVPALCTIQIDRGNLFYDQDRFQDAWDAYSDAMVLASQHDLTVIAAKAMSNLGAVAYMMDRYPEAVQLLDSTYKALGNEHALSRAELLRNIAMARSKMGEEAAALKLYQTSLVLSQQLNDTAGITKTYQTMSSTLWDQGRRAEAINMLQTAVDLSRKSGWVEAKAESMNKLGSWYTEQGLYKEALALITEANTATDSLARNKFNLELANAEVRYDTERKERLLELNKVLLTEERLIKERRSFQRNILFGALALLVVIGFIGYRNIRHRQTLALQQKELSEQRVEEIIRSQELRLVNAMIEGQVKERSRIAQDLHDGLGSLLSATKMQLGALESKVNDLRSDQQVSFERTLTMLDNAVEEVRRISHDMARGALAQFGLNQALQDLCESIRVNGKLDVELSLFGLEERMDRTLEITAFRIIQELISNVLKHAKASELTISLTRNNKELSIVVTDNGRGFSVETRKTGMGLNNVKDRATRIGGTFDIDSTIGKGTTVSVALPV